MKRRILIILGIVTFSLSILGCEAENSGQKKQGPKRKKPAKVEEEVDNEDRLRDQEDLNNKSQNDPPVDPNEDPPAVDPNLDNADVTAADPGAAKIGDRFATMDPSEFRKLEGFNPLPLGEQLFIQTYNCASCHDHKSDIRAGSAQETASAIVQAIDLDKGGMGKFAGQILEDKEFVALAKYIQDLREIKSFAD